MNLLYQAIAMVQDFTLLSLRAATNIFRRPRYIRDTFVQMDVIGVGSLTIIVLTGFFTGAVLALQTADSLKKFGAVGITGQLVALTLIKELGPVLTALMLAGRIGSGIASELGSMVVTEQINAMRALGTDPTKKLVTPRVLSSTLMTPLLVIVADVCGLIGGWLVAFMMLRLSTTLYWATAMRSVDYSLITEGLLKPFVFGFIVAVVGCFCGLRTHGGTRGVGRSTTQAVVAASILVIVADYFLSYIFVNVDL